VATTDEAKLNTSAYDERVCFVCKREVGFARR